MELPAIIRPAGTGDDDEQSDLLVEALLENDLRRDLDPLARARGYQRLIDTGLTVKGVAERLQTTQARVREHLRILKLPEELQDKFASGEVPVRAVKPLGQLAGIHPGLAIAAAQQVLDPGDAYEPYAWADVERAPLEVALAAGDLPEGVYRPHTAYPIEAFALGEGASKDLAAIERMLGRPVEHVQFDGSDVAQARALGAAHGENWHAIIVGTDVAAQLVGDYLARSVKELRKRAREERKLAAQTARLRRTARPAVDAADGSTGVAGSGHGATVDPEEARRAEREAERQAREQATRFNLELGRAVYTSLSRVRVDEPVLKLLASVEIVGELADVAMRGARYGFPGWVTETTQKNGKTKYGYLDKPRGRAARQRVPPRRDQAGRDRRPAARAARDGDLRRPERRRGLEPQLAPHQGQRPLGRRDRRAARQARRRQPPGRRTGAARAGARAAARPSSRNGPRRARRARRPSHGWRASRSGSAS